MSNPTPSPTRRPRRSIPRGNASVQSAGGRSEGKVRLAAILLSLLLLALTGWLVFTHLSPF